ncbi:helix-turn-helix transcriptional regulator [Amycolatopsis sp. NPDC059021]|uniref:helix-turn-helix transcriptional regulator n=1 Tax=Amycolatopsis sp. NPDC059021 TaxID=3346704 RepID=UPI0036719D72
MDKEHLGGVDRFEEIGHLRRAAESVSEGRPRFVVLGGEAGVGKTHLVRRFAATAAGSGFRVLTGACVELGSEGIPLIPVVSVLRELLSQTGDGELSALLPGWPILAGLVPEHRPGGDEPEPPGQAQLFHLFTALLERLSQERPVLLIIEDLHWSDRSTRDLLAVLARVLRGVRVLIVLTHRSDDPRYAERLAAFLAELERAREVSHLDLARFTKPQTAELISARLGEPAPASLVDRIFARSGGNAFFVEELLRAESPGHSGHSLRELLLTRLQRLPEPAQRVIRTAAVAGRSVSHRLLAAVLAMPDDALFDAVRAAVDGQALEADGAGYRFRHALLQEAVIGSLLPGERLALHRRYAEVLTDNPLLTFADRLDAMIAHHWCHAEEPDRALPALIRAARNAEALRAFAEQHQWLERALEMWAWVRNADELAGVGHLEVLEAAGLAAWNSGQPETALELIDRALDETDRSLDRARATVLLARQAKLRINLGRPGALEAVDEAYRLTPPDLSASGAAAFEILGRTLLSTGQPDRARDICQKAVDIAAGLGDVAVALTARTTLAVVHADLGDHERALAELRELKALAARHGQLSELERIHVHLALMLWSAGRYEEAIDATVAGTAVADRAGSSATWGVVLVAQRAAVLVAVGRWPEAEAQVAEALARGPEGMFAISPRLIGAELAVARGDFAAAKEHLEAVRELNKELPTEVSLARLTTQIAMHENRIDDARAAAGTALQAVTSRTSVSSVWALLITAAQLEAYAYLRDRALDTGSGDDLLDTIRKVADGLPATAPPWRASAAQLAAELDSFDRPSPAWPEVAAAWDEAGQPYQACHARMRAAEAASARGERDAAARWLGAAVQEADRLGARSLREQLDQLARRARIPLATPESASRRPAVEKLGLTPREVEVLRLVAEGRSNRQIAQQLFIAGKTASVHVSRILAKLGVSTRGEAAAAAHRLRLFDETHEVETSPSA